MKRYPILLIAWLAPGVAGAGLKETLQNALKNYCIPKDAAGCDEGSKARYDASSGACVCDQSGYSYDTSARSCAKNCSGAPGTIKMDITDGCPAGTISIEASGGSCPIPGNYKY